VTGVQTCALPIFTDEFNTFAREMHQENCRERELYNEPLLSYDEYIDKNRQFLLDNFPEV